jgi:hypothetical protein
MKKMIAVFALLLMLPVQAGAQGIDLSKLPETPHYDMPQAEFEEKTNAVELMPFGDKFLAHEMRVPKDWKKIELEISAGSANRLLGDAVKYVGPTLLDAPSYFVLQAANIEYDITIRNWFINHVLTNGYVLQTMKQVSDRSIEAIYVMVERDISYLVRVLAQINGSRVVMAKYFLPEAKWEQEKALQSMVINSFKFTNPEPPIGEDLETYAFLDLIRFDYPKSWRLEAPNIFSVDAMDAKIVNSVDGKVLNGEVRIFVVSTEMDTTLADEIQKVQKTLESRNFAVGEMIPLDETYKFQDHFTFTRVESYKVVNKVPNMIEHEYWIGIMVEDRYFYIVTLLTPSRNAEFYTWARNIEAFRKVLETMRP